LESRRHAKQWYDRFGELVDPMPGSAAWSPTLRAAVRVLLCLALWWPTALAAAAAVVGHHPAVFSTCWIGYSAGTLTVRRCTVRYPTGAGVPAAAGGGRCVRSLPGPDGQPGWRSATGGRDAMAWV